MKKFFLLAAALVVMSATTATAEITVNGDAYVGLFDKYLWRGYDLSGSLPVTQGGIDLSFKNLTLSYWTNVQMSTDTGEGYRSGEGSETDITVDYEIPVGEIATVNLGNIFYTMDGTMGGGPDTSELYLGASLNTLLAPSVKVYYDWDELKDDRFYTASVSHAFTLGSMELGLGALASYADNDGSHEPWNAELSAGLDIPVIDQVNVKPTFVYSVPLGDDAKEALDIEMAGGVTLTLIF